MSVECKWGKDFIAPGTELHILGSMYVKECCPKVEFIQSRDR